MKRKKAPLLIGLVLALAATGVVYAQWVESAAVDAEVGMGSAGWAVVDVSGYRGTYTDDDGKVDLSGFDSGDTGSGTAYNRWGTDSSNDPSTYSGAPGKSPADRHNSDVARCWVTDQGIGGTVSTFRVENAYPGYHCTVRQNGRVTGSVPLKNQAQQISVCLPDVDDCDDPANFAVVPHAGGYFRFDADGDGVPELEMIANWGGACGYRLDVNQLFFSRIGLSVLDAAPMNSNYVIRYELVAVNWNQWNLSDCSGWRQCQTTGRGTPSPGLCP